MDSWGPTQEGGITFANLYQSQRPQPPTENSTSYKTKTLTVSETAHALSLKTLRHLDITSMELGPGHDFRWGMAVLANNGPAGELSRFTYIWDPEFVVYMIPGTIDSENNVHAYTKSVLFEPALPGAICLYESHKDLERRSGHPVGSQWEIADVSAAGKGGRLDLCLRRRVGENRKVMGIECKTARVDSSFLHGPGSQTVSVLERTSQLVATGPVSMHPGAPAGTSDLHYYDDLWKRKMQSFMFQVWFQLRVQQVMHTVLCTQNAFLLCYASHDELHLSEAYPISSATPQVQQRSLSCLAYFISCAISAHNHFDAMRKQPIESVPLKGSIIASVRGLPLFKRLFPVRPPLFVVFSLFGARTPPLPLTTDRSRAVTPTYTNTVALNKLISPSAQTEPCVYWGRFGQSSIYAKIANGHSDALANEYKAYERLARFDFVPHCYGLFEVQAGKILIINDAGKPIPSFDLLTLEQRESLMASVQAMHRCGVLHGDLEPRNIVISDSGQVMIIDFGMAVLGHGCVGSECAEIRRLRMHLE